MHHTANVSLSLKEREAIMWGLGQVANYPDRPPLSETDPLAILLAEGFSRQSIMDEANDLIELSAGTSIKAPLSDLRAALLRACVENSTWLSAYADDMPSLLGEAQATLRSLAAKLDSVGVQVNFIPAD